MEMEDGVSCGLDNFPAQLLNQYYPPYEAGGGSFAILPLHSNDWYNYKIQRKYSLLDNECLKEKWKKFVCDPSMEKTLKFPTARGNHFINQVARYQPPNEILGYCRAPLSLVPGPLVDEYGALPIPADYHERYRERYRPEPKKKVEKKKKMAVKITEPTPPLPTPPVISTSPPPPMCNCPPLPFYCSCPVLSSYTFHKVLPPTSQQPPTPPQTQNAVCTPCNSVCLPPHPKPSLPPTPPRTQNAVCTPCNSVCLPPHPKPSLPPTPPQTQNAVCTPCNSVCLPPHPKPSLPPTPPQTKNAVGTPCNSVCSPPQTTSGNE